MLQLQLLLGHFVLHTVFTVPRILKFACILVSMTFYPQQNLSEIGIRNLYICQKLYLADTLVITTT